MLYQSLHVPAGDRPFPRDVINDPRLAKYVRDWGRAGDLGYVAFDESNGAPVGAAWLRLLTSNDPGYGYVNDETPEIGMAVLSEYRGRGIGSELLRRLVQSAGGVYRAVSLSVTSDNQAVRLYERAGFERVCERENSITMLKKLEG
jgi:ribosomal protein S18 acetylase RimI-like enzyme